jgi:hypothetical protein
MKNYNRPSGAERWFDCSASAALERYLNEQGIDTYTTSPEAVEGTRAHTLASEYLERRERVDNHDLSLYIDYVLDKLDDNSELYVEQRLSLSNYIRNGSGTCDALIIRDNHADIFDLKFGLGLRVSAYKNKQLLCYALGVMQKYGHIETFTLHIIQPRLDYISEYNVTRNELIEFGESVKRAIASDLKYHASTHTCRFCPVKLYCKKLNNITKKVINMKISNAADILYVLDHADVVNLYINTIKTKAIDDLKANKKVGDYTLVPSRAKRVFTEDAQAILESNFGDSVYEKSLKCLTALEKQIGRKKFAELDVTEKKSSGFKLVKAKDAVSQIFGDN